MQTIANGISGNFEFISNSIGLHNQPARMRNLLQQEIDQTQPGQFAAILLGYGLCGAAMHGICSRDIPLVLPRAHDCITLHLGSREKYMQQHLAFPGTYWFSERVLQNTTAASLGATSFGEQQADLDTLINKYGQENAAFLQESMNNWKNNYTRAVYLQLEHEVETTALEKAREIAKKQNWQFEIMSTNVDLLENLLRGNWQDDFLIVPPHHQIHITGDEQIITARPC